MGTAEVETGGGDDHNPLEDGAKNPLDDNASNPLDDDPLNAVETTTPLNTEVRSNPLGLDYGSDDSNSKSETGSTEQSQPQAQMNEEDKLLATVTCDDAAEEPMDNAENPLDGANPLEKSGENPLGDSERLPGVAVADHREEMSEEDLLTGPAHNLDDSQYKADYADPNLDDIFK